MKFVYLIAFVKEFAFCLKTLQFRQAWNFATVRASLAVRVRKIIKANIEGQKAYIKNAKIENNPYSTDPELHKAWSNGYACEKMQWEWKSNVPEFLRKQA